MWHFDKLNVPHSIFLTDTNEGEIIDTINSLINRKSPGIDNLRAETLKGISAYIAAPLTFLINRSFQIGVCPVTFKVAVVKPIYKNADELEKSNYRPISLISNVRKVFEKILKKTNYKLLKSI